MSAPFAPGDVVQCVDDRPCLCGCGDPSGLTRGKLYRPISVFYWEGDGGPYWACTVDGCQASEHHAMDGISCARFRKIDDEVEESFRLMLRSIKTPPVPAVPHIPAGFLVPRSVAAHIFGEG